MQVFVSAVEIIRLYQTTTFALYVMTVKTIFERNNVILGVLPDYVLTVGKHLLIMILASVIIAENAVVYIKDIGGQSVNNLDYVLTVPIQLLLSLSVFVKPIG